MTSAHVAAGKSTKSAAAAESLLTLLRDDYKELFSDEIRKVCRKRLEQYGYSVNIYENRTEGKNDA